MRPAREPARNNQQTYFVTSQTWERRALFSNERWARLLVDTVYRYRSQAYLLHGFVIMPDHFHALITPNASLEKAVQLIKGGFSFRVKKELGSCMEVWQPGFSDHRIRDAADYWNHLEYIHLNPVRRLVARPEEYAYSSVNSQYELDPVPQGLKPLSIAARDDAAKAAPLQRQTCLKSTVADKFDQQIPRSDQNHTAVPFAGLIATNGKNQ